jgi:hypothetical protein
LYQDASTSKLSPNISRRLQDARRAALVAMNSRTAAETVAVGGGTLARTAGRDGDVSGTPMFWGAALLAALALALYAGAAWDQNRRAAEAAEADLEILASDVPMDAYFDKGFKSFVDQTK